MSLKNNPKSRKYYFVKHLHVFWMVSDTINHLGGFNLSGGNFMDSSEQGEFVFHILSFEHMVYFFSSRWSLKKVFTCNFWPFNISSSNSLMDLPLVTNAAQHLRLRPPIQNKSIMS